MLPNLRTNILNRCWLPRALPPRYPATPPTRAAAERTVGATRSPANRLRGRRRLVEFLNQWGTTERPRGQSRLGAYPARVGSDAPFEYVVCRLEVWQSKRNTSGARRQGGTVRRDSGFNQHISAHKRRRSLHLHDSELFYLLKTP